MCVPAALITNSARGTTTTAKIPGSNIALRIDVLTIYRTGSKPARIPRPTKRNTKPNPPDSSATPHNDMKLSISAASGWSGR
jgi:hypothetical protein